MERLLFYAKFLFRRFGLGFWTLQQDIQTVNKELKTVAVSQLEAQSVLRDEFARFHEDLSELHGELFGVSRSLRERGSFEVTISQELGCVRADTVSIRAEIKEIWAYLHSLPEECLTGQCPYKQHE